MKIMDRVADLLASTREYIREHGWAQGTLNEENGHVCMMGGMAFCQGLFETDNESLEQLVSEHEDMTEAVWLLASQLDYDERKYDEDGDLQPAPVGVVTCWNDADTTTQTEVEDLLAKCEKIARAGFDPDEGIIP